ncbi:hypothetical protein IGI38_003027 [Enterococcus sp. AZ128]
MLLRTDDSWDVSFYQVIILSESLSNKEVKLIMPKLKEKNALIFRKCGCDPSKKEKDLLDALKIDQWISKEIGIDNLRELISESTSPILENVKETQLTRNLDDFLIDLTKNQKKCFLKLYEAHSSIVSREELCHYIWNVEPNRSNLAQLSVLAKSIRQKLIRKGFPSDVIETVWGKGYHLNKESYNSYRGSY